MRCANGSNRNGWFNRDKNTNRITFPKHIVENSIKSLPSVIDLYDRGGKLFSTIGGDSTHFVPAHRHLNIFRFGKQVNGEVHKHPILLNTLKWSIN